MTGYQPGMIGRIAQMHGSITPGIMTLALF
jgi:hypothetical protein